MATVILDVDGTLVDSNDAHAGAWVDAFAAHGITVPFVTVRRAIGMGGDKLMPAVAGIEEESPQGKAIAETRGRVFKERYLPRLKAFDGVRALVERFDRDGFTLAVASSAQADELSPLLEVAGVADLLRTRTSSSDAEASKPEPDIIEAALDASGSTASESVMIGDTPYDVEAATRAGVAVVAFTSGGWPADALAGAAEIYKGAADLLARYEQSVFSRLRGRDGQA